ncbi:MAG: hypothetical protein JWO19_2807 [Bryobacterales bacterium]|nr:hypothetical protein [Bryobacterales bacterium]
MVWGLAVTVVILTSSRAEQPVSFTSDIKPIMEASCWNCHGPSMQLSKLDLRTRESALKGGEHGPAIVPGKADESRLYRLVAGLEKPAMPMDGSKLTAAQIAAFKTWINDGAHWDLAAAPAVSTSASPSSAPLPGSEAPQLPPGARDYWAFKLPAQAPLPNVGANLKNPIDRFLEAARQEKGLKPAPKADRLTLLRRAYLDLIGMPPTPAQTAEFMADNSPDAWPKLIDKLLASPHYGERWGRHWLDVARYADSAGYEDDHDRPNVWRYRDYVVKSFNDDKPYSDFITEQLAGDEIDNRTNDTYIATNFLRAGPRVEAREKDNPQYRYDYLDDVIATVGKGMMGLTMQCARCHNHKFDPILQKDYYAMQASFWGYVETTYPLASKDEVDAYNKKVAEITAKQAPMRSEIRKIEAPYRQKLMAEAIKKDFPELVQKAVAKPEAERTEGERLLADQVLKSAQFKLPIDETMTPEELARKKELNKQIAELEKQRPKPLPMADITTDGDYRFSPRAAGDEALPGKAGTKEDEIEGSFLHTGPGKYKVPPSYLLVRGDMNSRGAQMQPGFLTVATFGTPPTEIERPDGHTSGRRLAFAQWLTSADNPLTARVAVNRIWAHHFGKGIVGTLDNFGKMGDQPTHQELLDWLAVEFRKQGWSIKQMHRLMMTSDAYQMASRYNDEAALSKDPNDDYLWRYRIQRLDAEVVRDSIMSAAGTIDLSMGGPPVFPHIQPELLKAVSFGSIHGIYRNQDDGPAVWRRSLYIYNKRNLPFPMMQVFDQPDLNISFGARLVSTVPTQALTLMNNEFVARQAKLFADRVKETAGPDPAKQVDTAYRLALTRPPTAKELSLGVEMVKSQSLVDFANVVLNLNEFLYTE